MPYSSIGFEIDNLPEVLAGPILRRTEPTQVSVWIAMRTNPGPLRLKVYLNGVVKAASQPTSLMRFGNLLYITVVTASVPAGQPLVANTVYTYDILLNDSSTGLADNTAGTVRRLASPGILGGPGIANIAAITYPNSGLTLPSFALPPANMANVRLVHTSCRKSFGGHYDALPAVSTMIETTVNSALGRPHQLFFTGDQIYADDVSSAGLVIINDIKSTFIGNWSEFGSRPDNTYLFGTPKVTKTEIGNRIEFVKSIHLSNSVKDGQNHLLGLGEFMAMYLLNWSDVLWPKSLNGLPNFASIYTVLGINETEEVVIESMAGYTPMGAPTPLQVLKQETELRKKFRDDSNKLWMTRQVLADVRRALANVPVYMMWDDHEVADDWFFSFNWTQKVMGWGSEPANPYGRLLIQNGMTAFNIFQGWGNAPERYVPFTAGGFLLQAASKIFASPTEWQVPKNWTDIAELVLPAWRPATFGAFSGTALFSPIEYDLVIHFGEYAVLMLDTRSNRFFRNTSVNDDTVGRDRPVLMRQEHLTKLVRETSALQTQHNLRVVIVVSPAPVIGHNLVTQLIEKTQYIFDLTPRQKLLSREPTESEAERRDAIDLMFDSEAWSGNAIGLEEALRQFAAFRRVIILSGDVHFSYSSVAQYWTDSQLPQSAAAFGQLTCSAAKNSTDVPGAYIQDASNKFLSNPGFIGNFIIAPRSFVGWNNSVAASGQPHRIRMRRSMGLWQVRAIPTVIALSDPLRNRYVLLNRNDLPDWRYTYSFCQDVKPDNLTMRRANYPKPINSNLTHWERLALEHEIYSQHINKSVVVNEDNVGEITFRWLGANAQNLQVQHGLWYAVIDSKMEPDPNSPIPLKPYTLHTLDLTIPTMADMPGEYFN